MLTSSLDTTMGKLNHLTQILYSPYDVIQSLNPIQFYQMSSGYGGSVPTVLPPLSPDIDEFPCLNPAQNNTSLIPLLPCSVLTRRQEIFIYSFENMELAHWFSCDNVLSGIHILLSLVNRRVLCCILVLWILCHHLGIIVITHKLDEKETRGV